MADVFTKKKRSQIMAAVRSTGNRETELKLAAIFRAHGITGWRRRQPLPGKPDFVFWRERLAVFVDGCFWHGCPKCYRRPSSNRGYWDAKVARNIARDKKVAKQLRDRGWRVARLWGHSLSSPKAVVARIASALDLGP